ncbi:hypothetical protein Mapa_002808 [Marchantia paleacea]|nr:hypothetical protein Mapa_002808 [Marchantia paleacea]
MCSVAIPQRESLYSHHHTTPTVNCRPSLKCPGQTCSLPAASSFLPSVLPFPLHDQDLHQIPRASLTRPLPPSSPLPSLCVPPLINYGPTRPEYRSHQPTCAIRSEI